MEVYGCGMSRSSLAPKFARSRPWEQVARWFQHAFAVEARGVAAPEAAERAVVERLVHEIVRRGLATPALLLLDCSHPLNFVGSQFLLYVAPFAELIFRPAEYAALTRFLERRGSIEFVCQRIEAIGGRSATVAGVSEQNVRGAP